MNHNFMVDDSVLERPKGMRKAMWDVIQADRRLRAQEQTVIVWSYRGFPIQWAQGPYWDEGPMLGLHEDDRPMSRGGVSLFVYHPQIIEAMNWAYDPSQPPPPGWRLATPEELLNRGPGQDAQNDEEPND